MSTFYITTPIYYTNAEPHAGHAYTTIAADVLARYHRLKGDEVFFLTGVDEHGENIQKVADLKEISPQAYCDQVAPTFTTLWKRLNISYDIFLRTTSELHKTGVTRFLNALYETGDIYKGKYEGYYCRPCERFFTEKEQGVDKTCPIHKLRLEWVEEDNYFFALSKFQDQLIKHIHENPEFIQPAARSNEILSVLETGLEDVSISRASVSWGIPLPFDPDHISYVWIEALSNYITALGFAGNEDRFQTFWPADIHLMAKDIVRFHAIIWPAMLMAVDLPLPKHVVAHGWLTKDGEALSKTRGIFIDMDADIETYGLDAFRYYLLREFSFGNDGDYRPNRLQARYNADLANDLGNLLNRTLGLVSKNFDGIPEPTTPDSLDNEVIQMAKETISKVDSLMTQSAFDMVLEAIWEFVRRVNRYIHQTQVWTLAKSEDTRSRMGTILYNSMEALRVIAVLISPFMPDTAARIRRQIGLDDSTAVRGLDSIGTWGGLQSGRTIGKPEPIFPRLDIKKRKARDKTSDVQEPQAEEVQLISIDEFQNLDLRVATITEAEKVPKADKLLRLIVDLGGEKRQVVAGISQHYAPDELIGKQVVVVVNLQPVKIRGIESQGMVLAAAGDETLVLATLDEHVTPGTTVR
ncbi:MAG: methionine--tRNA ligase [Candidatus Poribacteria bacterium]|nr:methionine--tRNA ligase [Candidatus Poribacteria bacterium]MDE0505041.1 methionine--tRNA ligase [Candidatus Poribacteria bacterium]